MSLGNSQREFTSDIALLILYANAIGYEFTFGDAYRDPRLHGKFGEKVSYASKNSEHKRRLAVDLNLFKDGNYLTSTEDHKPLGNFWESLNQNNVWGGRWNDGNHYQRDP